MNARPGQPPSEEEKATQRATLLRRLGTLHNLRRSVERAALPGPDGWDYYIVGSMMLWELVGVIGESNSVADSNTRPAVVGIGTAFILASGAAYLLARFARDSLLVKSVQSLASFVLAELGGAVILGPIVVTEFHAIRTGESTFLNLPVLVVVSVLGSVIFVFSLWVLLRGVWWRGCWKHQIAERMARSLEADYPDEVTSVGGAAGLGSARAVEEFMRSLQGGSEGGIATDSK